ncbi:putative tRNA-m1A22 methylase [Tetragenococcus muriaticus 3MR10-3]|uniref:Putative tRNA-m1A22 methylase n=2 Tax=Tetragenococcus muriaticus TaxID=64642 RepID=A0A091CCR8_9ENTE|nr:putative tRNA-m1A22 methylase [Tetragenococcus muriaticus 3MR10-3]
MGGLLTKRILTEGQAEGILTNKERLILQPNNHEQLLRHWLATNYYQIYDEEIIEDHDKIYEIIAAFPQKKHEYTLKELYFGPILMEKKSVVFQKKWQKILQTKQKILINLKNAQYPPADKIDKIKKEITWIKEVLE